MIIALTTKVNASNFEGTPAEKGYLHGVRTKMDFSRIFCGLLVIFISMLMHFPGMASDRVPIFQAETGRVVLLKRIEKSGQDWRRILTPLQYHITREKGTEPAFTGKYHDFEGKGLYRCVACGTDLFDSTTQFHSGTGWPSFRSPVSKLNVRYRLDKSFGMRRIEILCARCGAHLGHVFDDGPPPTGKRYCINSAALKFAGTKR